MLPALKARWRHIDTIKVSKECLKKLHVIGRHHGSSKTYTYDISYNDKYFRFRYYNLIGYVLLERIIPRQQLLYHKTFI